MHTLTIRDESAMGDVLRQIEIEMKGEICTLRDLIEQRVRHEVATYNQALPEYFFGLVQPSEAEKVLNGFRMRSRQVIDAEKQVYHALRAFQQNGFFVLINDRQVESLEEEIWLGKHNTASFIKLTPLVGG